MIPQGKYPVRAIEGALVSKKTGAQGVDVVVEIAEGEHAGDRLRWYGHLINSDNTNSEYAQRVIESLRYLGWEGDDLTDLRGLGSSLAQAVIEHRPNAEGKVFAEVRWINALGGGAKIADESRVTGSAAKALAQRFSSLARGVKAKAPANGAKPARVGGPSDEELAAAFGDDTF
jgi:hypothetical protein